MSNKPRVPRYLVLVEDSVKEYLRALETPTADDYVTADRVKQRWAAGEIYPVGFDANWRVYFAHRHRLRQSPPGAKEIAKAAEFEPEKGQASGESRAARQRVEDWKAKP